MIIVIGGEAGSGKSATAKLLAKKLKLKHYSNGDFMGKLAEERGISLLELSKLAEKDSSIDHALDERQIQLGKTQDNFVIDSRLGFHFIPNSIKIFLKADLNLRAKRILSDSKNRKDEHNSSLEETKLNIKRREESENKRYKKYYAVEPYDEKNFDITINTTGLSVEETVSKMIDFIKKKKPN